MLEIFSKASLHNREARHRQLSQRTACNVNVSQMFIRGLCTVIPYGKKPCSRSVMVVLTEGLGTQRRGSELRYVGLQRPGKHPGGAISPPPDFIFSGEYIAHDPHGSSSNFSTLEGEWYCLSKILANLSYSGYNQRAARPLRAPGDDRLSRNGGDVTGHALAPPSAPPRPSSHACLRRRRLHELLNYLIGPFTSRACYLFTLLTPKRLTYGP